MILTEFLFAPDGAVAAQPEEDGPQVASSGSVEKSGSQLEAQVGHVVVDADREVRLGLGLGRARRRPPRPWPA